MSNEINPLTSAEVDLRGLPWMRLDVIRLMDSDLFALSTGDEFKAAVALWCKSWHQVPAGSLPDDDRVLAHLSGAGSRWKRVRDMALRGWVKGDDGRLHHTVIEKLAESAWAERQKHLSRREKDKERLDAWRDLKREKGELSKTGGLRVPHGTETPNETELKRVSVALRNADETSKTGRDGTGRKDLTEKKPPDGGSPAKDDPKDLIWKTGVALLTKAGNSAPSARTFLGQFAKNGAETKLAEVIGYLAANPKVEPKAYIVAAMTRKQAGETRTAMSTDLGL